MNVCLADAVFSYGEKRILDHVTLTLPEVQVVALAGPSGCGKTTLLRLFAGLERLERGSLQAPPPEQCAILFQEDRLLPGFTAAQQVAVVLPRGERPHPYLHAVGLDGEEDRLPSQLSGGMRRRVALARLLAYGRGKSLLLLDEPFTGIDPPRAAQIMEAVRGLGIPVILCAHEGETLALADRVIPLDQVLAKK